MVTETATNKIAYCFTKEENFCYIHVYILKAILYFAHEWKAERKTLTLW